MRLGSVRARLMVWNVAIVAILTVALGFAVSWRTRGELMAGIDKDLLDRAERLMGLPGWGPGFGPGPPLGAGRVPGGAFVPRSPGIPPAGDAPPRRRGPPPGEGPSGGPDMAPGVFDPATVFVSQGAFRPRVFDTQGRSITQFEQDQPWDRQALARPKLGAPGILTDATWQGEEHRVLTLRLRRGERDLIVQYATPLAETRRAIAGINQILFAMLPLALFVAGLGGYVLTERALRPVGRIAELAERIEGENLSERLPVEGTDEFAQLSRTINASLDRLESAFRKLAEAIEREKRFTADASHELKTPLTAIKAETSLALSSPRTAGDYRKALEAVDRSASRMAELIGDLLLLARKAPGEGFGEVSLQDVLSAAAAAVPSAESRLVAEVAADASSVYGDHASLVRLLVNLLSNAVRHTPPEGRIVVRSRRMGDAVVMEVEDTGEGIAPEHMAHLGERFYRADSARSRAEGGVGLGLAICREIVEAHGGEIRFESQVGKGTRVIVHLPAA